MRPIVFVTLLALVGLGAAACDARPAGEGGGGIQPTSGAHTVHTTDAGAFAEPFGCAQCHDPRFDVTLSGSLATANGARPSFSAATLTCSNVYCHTGGPQLLLGGGTVPAPVWNPPSPVGCGACHALPGSAVGTTTWHPAVAAGVQCALCHPGYTNTIVNKPIHVNGVVNLTVPDLATSCAACHGDAGRPLPAGSPTVVRAAPPVDRNGASSTGAVGVGAHQGHLLPGANALASPIACAECHVVPTDLVHVGPTATTPATVIWGSLASANGASPALVPPPPGSTSLTCSNVYCHAGGPGLKIGGGTLTSPTWNPPSAVTCGSCHALPGGPVDTSSWHPAIALGADCGLCHPGYTRASVNPAIHVNGKPDVIATGLQVNCTACHGDATRSLPPGTPEVVKAAPPVDRTGSSGTSGPGVGAHQSHLVPGPGAISLPVACSECHVVPTSLVHVGPAPTTPATLDWGPLASAKGATPSFDSTAVTCSNYCHGQTLPVGGGSNTQPKWTTVNGSQAACGTCHGQPPSTGQHLLHTTTYTLRVSCGVCHPGGYAPGVVGAAAVPLHVNGETNMNPNGFTDWNPAAASGSGWRGTAIGCHGGTRYWFTGSGSSCQ